MSSTGKQKTVIVGAGPVGALAALYAARRGHEVEIYELRGDLRDASTTPLNFTKSINLALSERGINSMKESGCFDLVKNILDDSIPMYGRMIHGRDAKGNLFGQSQQYDINKKAIRAVDRAGLNSHLLDELEKLPNVTFFFNHKLTGADFNKNLAWFHRKPSSSTATTPDEIEVSFDFLLGADGAHSSVRYHLMKYTRVNYSQEYINTLWCEFRIPPSPTTDTHLLSPHFLHIWPGREYMFIAIPSLDRSFTCTLFLPSTHFTSLSSSPSSSLLSFFSTHFPGVTPDLISPADLVSQFQTNPHLPLISIKCTPYHQSSSVVILGDAAHAMVPFYGQGMNAGLEDVRVLFSHLDQHPETQEGRAAALEAYTQERTPDAHTINDLALRNYEEMRSGVTRPLYKTRKAVEEWVSRVFPGSGWRTQYARVSFGNERYSEVKREVERQGRWLGWGLAGGVVGVVGVGVGVGLSLWKRGGRR